MICLGCGNPVVTGDCPRCYAKLRDTVASSHWPLETSLSPLALVCVESAVHKFVVEMTPQEYGSPLGTELSNLCAIIRAHLQHVRTASKAVEKDPLLL